MRISELKHIKHLAVSLNVFKEHWTVQIFLINFGIDDV